MKTTLKILAFCFAVSAAANAQVVPAATGPGGLPIGGNLQYALRYSQAAQFSTSYPTMATSTASGSLDYMNGSERHPFSIDYTGGYTWTFVGPTYETGVFQRMLLTQDLVWRKWKVLASDDVSYLPQSPTTGFSGIPGIGEPIGVTNPNPSTSQTILALNTHVVDNLAVGKVGHNLSSATILLAGGSSELLRFPNNDGYNTNTESGNVELTQRLNARNILSGKYTFSQFSYPDLNVSFQSNTGLFGFQRKWTRNLISEVAGGPQWLSSSDSAQVPTSTNVAISASVNYLLRFTSAGLSYSRGTSGGAGYLIGGEFDSLVGNLSHEFGTNLTVGLTGGYQRTAGLNNNGVTGNKYGGAQATRRFGRNLIVFASYTGTDQSTTSILPTNALSQLLQVIGFGIGYSPRDAHLRQ